MRIESLIFAIVSTTVVALASRSKPCRYWCRAEHDRTYYCCPSGRIETWKTETGNMWPMISSPTFWIGIIGSSIGMASHKPHAEPPAKKTHCPPVRWSCPRSTDWYDPPIHCDHDEECGHEEKCCYDICLEHRVCKPAERH